MNLHAPLPQTLTYEQITAGFAARQVVKLVKAGRLTWEDVYRVIPERTFKRRQLQNAMLRTDEADAIARLLRVSELATWALQDEGRAQHFLHLPNPELGNKIPWDMALTDVGAREVEGVLLRFVHGIYG
jgi:putative toxin-antitoxin system antitoxin component (TIGR02293 family)